MPKILNCGCGKDIYGTDFIDKYPLRKEVIKWDADKDKIPFPDNTFDEVHTVWLLEHLRNPGFFLDECFRVLKPNGKMTLITANAAYIGYYLPIFRTASQEFYGGHYPHGKQDIHYVLFTTFNLKKHFKTSGFKHIRVTYYNDKFRWWVMTAIKIMNIFSRKLGNCGIKVIAEK